MARLCPLCQAAPEEFLPFSGEGITRVRPGAQCPKCRSLERHRLAWLYLINETDLFASTGKRLLHIAPEAVLAARLSSEPSIEYLPANLDQVGPRTGSADATWETGSIDAIYCGHLLDRVIGDGETMRELRRLLREGGWVIPLIPAGREHRATPDDSDYKASLAKWGFEVHVDPYPRRLGAKLCERYGLLPNEVIYRCNKAESGGIHRPAAPAVRP